MKRILFLAPYSVPVNGPEAICNAKLLRVLSDAGYIIDVISKNNSSSYAPIVDERNFVENLSSLKIFKLSNRINFRTIIEHILIFLKTGYVYKGAHWAYYAINYSEKLINEYHYDWIMSRSPSSELAALYLSKKYGIKWIANWNDPYPEKKMPIPYGKGAFAKLPFIEQCLLKAVSEHAEWHTFPNERQRDYMLQYMQGVKQTAIIPHVCINSYSSSLKTERVKCLRIVHSGNVAFPRNPEPFLEGIVDFLLKVPDANLEVFFIGKQNSDFTKLIQKLNIEKVIKVIKPLNYIDNLAFIAQCDVALLIEAPMDNGVFLPTKVGDYMQCGKDIFAISPINGTLHDLYMANKIEYFADNTNPLAISRELSRIYSHLDEYNSGKYKEIIADYSAATILEIYKSILGE